jgi:Flp pilus assembly protein TadG
MSRSRRTDGRRGTAALEFAIAAPVLALLLLAGTDLSMYFLKKFRLDNTASELGNLVAEASTLSLNAFPAGYCSTNAASLNYFAIASQLASPLPVCGNGVVNSGATIISGIANDGKKTTIVWQQRTGDAQFKSQFGAAGTTSPTFPPGYSLPSGHSVIATEIYSGVSLWSTPTQALLGAAGPSSIYSYSVFEPRSGTLLTPQ